MTSAAYNRWTALGVLCMGSIMVMLDGSILNVAIPALASGLPASLDQVLWVLNAYTITWAMLLITAGRLGDLYGSRRLFILGLIVFTCGSAACGLAQYSGQLIAARVVQGIGGALLSPQTLAMLQILFDETTRSRAISTYAGLITLGPVVAQPLGGVLITYLGWRSVFFVNLPLGIIVLLLTLRHVPNLRTAQTRTSLDPIGVLLLGAALFCLSFGLLEGSRFDWGTVVGPISIQLLLVAAVALSGLFTVWNRGRVSPLVPRGLFRTPTYAHMCGLYAAASAGMVAIFLPLSVCLQSVLGLSALQAGLVLLPLPVTVLVINTFVANRLAGSIGARWTLVCGLVLVGIGSTIIYVSTASTAQWATLLLGLVVVAAGPGLIFTPLTATAVRRVVPDMAGAASGVLNTSGQLGAVLGSAAVGALFESTPSQLDAFHLALVIPLSIAAFGALSCALIESDPSVDTPGMSLAPAAPHLN